MFPMHWYGLFPELQRLSAVLSNRRWLASGHRTLWLRHSSDNHPFCQGHKGRWQAKLVVLGAEQGTRVQAPV